MQPLLPMALAAVVALGAASPANGSALPIPERVGVSVPAVGQRPFGAPGDREFARVPGGLSLVAPARHVVMFAYHESLFGTAMAMRPRGKAVLVDHPRFDKPTRTPGPRYIVMASRGRGTGPTTAVDVVLTPGTKVVAPVTGRVVDVSVYRLYCSRIDKRVIIRPYGHPKRRVVVFHLEHVRVQRGDVVEAGRTGLGVPRWFRGAHTQYDDYLGGDKPHVHVEVERRPGKPLPGCRA